MKLLSNRRHQASAQVLAEACIGLSLMVFAWILISYSLYLANYRIRTEMAARYAAWYQANGGDQVTGAQLDQYFFFQSGLSSSSDVSPALIGQVLEGNMPTNAASYTNVNGSMPFKVQVTFGPSSLDATNNPFPFNLLNSSVRVPLMPSSTLSTFQVNSACQWDDDGDCWTNASSAFSGMWNTLIANLGSFFSG